MVKRFVVLLLCLILLGACGSTKSSGELQKVGLLVTETVDDQVWGTKGYKGLLKIHSKFNVEVYYKEGINTKKLVEQAVQEFEQMITEGVDVIYPAGVGYNIHVIEKVKEHGLFIIGYVSDQSDLGESTVLTSTIQQVDKLYENVAKQFNNKELKAGNLSFDFQDNVISLGKFSPLVKKDFIQKLNKQIDKYKKTGELPE